MAGDQVYVHCVIPTCPHNLSPALVGPEMARGQATKAQPRCRECTAAGAGNFPGIATPDLCRYGETCRRPLCNFAHPGPRSKPGAKLRRREAQGADLSQQRAKLCRREEPKAASEESEELKLARVQLATAEAKARTAAALAQMMS